MTTTVTLDRYVLESLMADLAGHDRTPAAYLVFLAIWSAGDGERVALSYAEIAARTGLSRRTVQTGVAHLHRRELLEMERSGPTETPRYRPRTPWRRWQGV
ncbi:MAG: helix-turn-helix domain-containing protein [Alphaproteobacteria bacterium]|nr:helix-turn-helix domain-containing protein [Alphaproteobacteria bacterium]MBU2378655.1 helix-turn-helix domain-containing protein [Alphaproteobacteria bacterium]